MIYCIDSPSDDPRFNLAAEEYLLRHKEDDFIMFYVNRPSVIIGKHQNIFREVNRAFLKDYPVPVIRRLTGGGTVWHDHGNLNFSFILNGEPGKLVDFGKYIRPVVLFLNKLGVPAETDQRNNILAEGLKISGNAEHIFKNRVLHHGTLLFDADLQLLGAVLRPNPDEITDKAVRSKPGRVTNISRYLKEPVAFSLFRKELREYCMNYFAPCENYLLTSGDKTRIGRLVKEKYDTWEWNTAYSPACVITRHLPPALGHLSVRITIKNGRVADILFPDEAPEEVRAAATHLAGIPYRPEETEMILESLHKKGKLSVISSHEWIRFLFD